MEKIEFHVEGMHCAACELTVEKNVCKLKDIKSADARLSENKLIIETTNPNKEEVKREINEVLKDTIYKVDFEKSFTKTEIEKKELVFGFVIAVVVMTLFFMIQKTGVVNITGENGLSLPFVFFIGLIASISTCMAVTGGLVLTISASYSHAKEKILPLGLFHISRIVSFLVLGGTIGLLGSIFNFGTEFYAFTGIILFVIMMILGINQLNVFPFFKKLQLTLPKSFTKKAVFKEEVKNIFTPILIGIATFFLPCGFTQSMQFSAIASGSLIQGALIMFVFALGTFPILAIISFSSFKLGEGKYKSIFFKAAGFLIMMFALLNLYSALITIGIINPLFIS